MYVHVISFHILCISGESILICKPNERAKAVTLVSSSLPPVQSCLVSREGEELSSSLKRAVIEVWSIK